MIINKRKLEKHGFSVEERGGEILIYPKSTEGGGSLLFNGFRDILDEMELSTREAEMLADKFVEEAYNRIIFNLFD